MLTVAARDENGAAGARRVLLGAAVTKVAARVSAVILVLLVLLVIAAAVRAMFGSARAASAVTAAERAAGAWGWLCWWFWGGLRRFLPGRCFKVCYGGDDGEDGLSR